MLDRGARWSRRPSRRPDMQTALAPRSGDAPDPILHCAHELAAMLAAGEAPGRGTLRSLMSAATGRSDADGRWTLRDGYDALELAQVLFVTGPKSPIDDHCPDATLRRLEAMARSLPTQSHRSEEQVALQAFSTPLPLAWLAGRAACLSRADTMLEPSAGTGLLACVAVRAGCRLLLNEIAPDRRRCLAAAFPGAPLSRAASTRRSAIMLRTISTTLLRCRRPSMRRSWSLTRSAILQRTRSARSCWTAQVRC